MEQVYQQTGFREVQTHAIPAPLRLASATECVSFERDSFGALQQMLAGVAQEERESVWQEIEQALRQFEEPSGFEGACEGLLAVGTR